MSTNTRRQNRHGWIHHVSLLMVPTPKNCQNYLQKCWNKRVIWRNMLFINIKLDAFPSIWFPSVPEQFSARVSSFISRLVVTDMNSKLMLLPRESLFHLAICHLKKRGGNWTELIFTKTSGIVTSHVPIFVSVPSNSPRSLCDRKS